MLGRKMTRDFADDPVDPDVLMQLLDTARRSPTAGNSQGIEMLVLDEPEAVALYWTTTFSEQGRARFRWQGLFNAPVLVSVYGDPAAYTERYSEPDKAATKLGEGEAAWATPYWLVDASMVTLALQLAAIDAGLGVLFFGQFDHAPAVARAFGVPSGLVTTGTVAIGHAAQGSTTGDGRSSQRSRRDLSSMVHRNGWVTG